MFKIKNGEIFWVSVEVNLFYRIGFLNHDRVGGGSIHLVQFKLVKVGKMNLLFIPIQTEWLEISNFKKKKKINK